MGADSETLNQWTPAPALTEPEWTREGEAWVARSANGRFVCTVTRPEGQYRLPWNYTNRFDGAVVANFDDMTEEGAKRRALEQLVAWKSTRPDTTENPVPALAEPSKWHPIAADIAATVAEKNAAYGDSVTRSADIMRVLYPDGIPVSAYGDALLIVRVLDKLSRIATDRDALGESPWRDIAGYALRACEGRNGT